MLRGYRSIIFAIGLILSAASPPKDSDGQQPKQDTQAKIGQSPADIAASLRNANESSNLTKPCNAGETKRDSDLCAQWSAADAAKSAAKATWFFGALGALIGFLTLAAAGAAAFYAKSAANETKISNNLFRDQARAKLVSREIEFHMPWQAESENKWPATLSFEIENVGDTAAHKIKCVATCFLYARRTRINRMRHTSFAGTVKAGATESVNIYLGVAKEDFDV